MVMERTPSGARNRMSPFTGIVDHCDNPPAPISDTVTIGVVRLGHVVMSAGALTLKTLCVVKT